MTAKRIKSFLLIIFTICMIAITFPITAHADLGDNAGGSGDGYAGGTAAGGASTRKYGYRFYVVDSKGNVISDVIDFQSMDNVNCSFMGNTTRIGTGKVNKVEIIPEGMPAPFVSSKNVFAGNGEALREWCLSDGEGGKQRLVNLMYNYLGEDIVGLFENTAYEYYVVLEPITWHDIFYYSYTEEGERINNNTGSSFYGTFYNWLQFYDKNNWPANFTSLLEQKILGTGLQLVRDEPALGLTNPGEFTEFFTLDNVGNQGWGIHLYFNKDIIETQTTCDETEGNKPHKAPAESKGTVTIVKNYRYSDDGGTTFKDGGCFVRENTCGKIVIENEQSYKIKAWRVSNNIVTNINSLKWEDTLNNWESELNGKTSDAIDVKGKVALYVLYEKVSGKPPKVEQQTDDKAEFTIPESSITHRVRFSESEKTSKLSTHKFSWAAEKVKSANKVKYSWVDNKIKVSLINSKADNYNKILVSKNGWESVVKNSKASSIVKYWAELERNLTSGSTISRTSWDYLCVLKRGQDNLTVAEWKNSNSVNQLMKELGFKVGNKKEGTRKVTDYFDSFSTYFTDDNSNSQDLLTIFGEVDGKQEVSDYKFIENTGLAINDIKVKVNVYSGSSNSGSDTLSGKIKAGTISFYPYIQMKYDTYASPYSFNASQLVNVLGEYKRTITFYDAAEVSFANDKDGSIKVNSKQWSTHASVKTALQKLLGNSVDAQNVMPGGVMFDIEIPPQNQPTIDVVTYQTVIEGDGLTQIVNTGGSITGDMTKDNIVKDHNDYVNTVIKAIGGVNVVQYVDKDATRGNAFSGQMVGNGVRFNNVTLSSENKYYFSNYDNTFLNATLLGTNTIAYTFRVGADGCVYMNNVKILEKGQDYLQISDKVAKNIDNKTFVVRKLLEGLETNTGDDKSAKWATEDGKWYNEAFDGVTVYIQVSKLSVGFKDTYLKSSILDPRLVPTQGSGMEEAGKKFHISQFGTNSYSTIYGSGQKNKIGEFKGVSVYVSDLRQLLISKPFYITNITSQDLN